MSRAQHSIMFKQQPIFEIHSCIQQVDYDSACESDSSTSSSPSRTTPIKNILQPKKPGVLHTIAFIHKVSQREQQNPHSMKGGLENISSFELQEDPDFWDDLHVQAIVRTRTVFQKHEQCRRATTNDTNTTLRVTTTRGLVLNTKSILLVKVLLEGQSFTSQYHDTTYIVQAQSIANKPGQPSRCLK